ncbi:MAG: restriction endonuclease subunit S [Flavobacteriaceae bacterium]
MRSNYKNIGDYISPIKIKNVDGKISNLQGINIDKYHMPSVANIVGVDLKKYKVVKKNQFACNRMHVGRDKRLPVALLKTEEEIIVSPAYDVFEIVDKNTLLPEYLMMWFSRKEFDRNCWFHTDADVRGGLSWDAFCNIKLPVPSPEKQQEIVKEYNTLVNRLQLNEQLIQKLEATAQAIYREWFVEFEFPNENGEPYKTNDGDMIWCEELGKEIPAGWKVGTLEDLYRFQYGLGNTNPNNDGPYPVYGAGGVIGGYDKFNSEDAPIIGHMGAYCGAVVFAYGKHFVTYNGVICLVKSENQKWFSYMSLLSKDLMSHTRGSSQPFVSYDMLYEIQTIIPTPEEALKFDAIACKMFKKIHLSIKENQKLTELKELLLSRLASVEK